MICGPRSLESKCLGQYFWLKLILSTFCRIFLAICNTLIGPGPSLLEFFVQPENPWACCHLLLSLPCVIVFIGETWLGSLDDIDDRRGEEIRGSRGWLLQGQGSWGQIWGDSCQSVSASVDPVLFSMWRGWSVLGWLENSDVLFGWHKMQSASWLSTCFFWWYFVYFFCWTAKGLKLTEINL